LNNPVAAALLCAAPLLHATRLAAQQPGMLVLESPASTEAMAYGNAPNLFSESPSLLFFNPALLGRVRGGDAGFQRYGGEGTLATLAGAGTFQGGGFAAGLQYMRYGTEVGLPGVQDFQSVALTGGSVGATELVGTIGYGREVRGIDAGISLKYVEQSLDGRRDEGFAVDLGLAKHLGPLMVSVVGRNLGPNLDLEDETPGTTTGFELPSLIAAGASTEKFELGPLDMLMTTQVMRRRDGEVIPAGGVEVSYWPVVGYTFRLRGGLQRVVDDARSPFTFGVAFTGDNITIEYAFQSFDGAGNAHRVGVKWR